MAACSYMPTKPTQLRIPPEVLKQLDAHAEQRGMTRTALILEAIEAHLKPIVVPAEEVRLATARQVIQTAQEPSGPITARCTEKGCTWTTTSPTSTPRCEQHGFSTVEFV